MQKETIDTLKVLESLKINAIEIFEGEKMVKTIPVRETQECNGLSIKRSIKIQIDSRD